MDLSNTDGAQSEVLSSSMPESEAGAESVGVEVGQSVGRLAIQSDEADQSFAITNELHLNGPIRQLSGINFLRVDAMVPRIH